MGLLPAFTAGSRRGAVKEKASGGDSENEGMERGGAGGQARRGEWSGGGGALCAQQDVSPC